MVTYEMTTERETAISVRHEMSEIYELTFPAVAKFVRNAGGSIDDAKDIFHDALVIYMEIISQGDIQIKISEKAYILGISKHLWIRTHQKDRHRVFFNDLENEISIPDDYFPAVNDKRLLKFLKATGKKCMNLLRAFYFQRSSLKKITSELGYSNEHSASVQKYKCLEKIRNVVKEKSLIYEDFTE